jgi:hypothetical protein
MAISTCVKCGGHTFELADTDLAGASNFRVVQCSNCGVPVGVIDPDARDQIEGLRRQIALIDGRLMEIARALVGLK